MRSARDTLAAIHGCSRLVEAFFAHTYLLLFGKLAVGGLLALAVPPFADMERGFYKSSAAVFLASACTTAAGELYLFRHNGPTAVVGRGVLAAWLVFTIVFTAYFVSLFTDRSLLRARFFPLAVATGMFALVLTGAGYLPANVSAIAGLVFLLPFLAGSALTGAAATGMLLGHWYLIDRGLDLGPLKQMYRYGRGCLAADLAAVLIGAAILWAWPASPWHEAFMLALGPRFAWLLAGRGAAWTLALFLVAMIRRTLAIPQTMAATGLFYMLALVVAVGEICGHWLLFRTGLPL